MLMVILIAIIISRCWFGLLNKLLILLGVLREGWSVNDIRLSWNMIAIRSIANKKCLKFNKKNNLKNSQHNRFNYPNRSAI